MLKNIFVFFVFFLLFSFTNQPAFAGGMMVSVYADTEGATNNNGLYLRVIRVYLNPTIPCKGTTLTFHLSPPQNGDYITTGSGTSTYTMQEDRTESGCNTYAKFGSMVKGVRQVSVDAQNGDTRYTGSAIMVHFDGEYHSESENGSPEGYNYRSSITDPYTSMTSNQPSQSIPTPTNVKISQIEITADPGTKKVHIFWDPIPGITSYTVYKAAGGQYIYQASVNTNLYEMNISASSVFYVAIAAKKDGVEGAKSQILTIDLAKDNISDNPGTVITDKPIESISSTPTTGDNDKTVDALNKKVASLEGKLAESEKKQSVLEQRIGDLINFIKRLFPFFN